MTELPKIVRIVNFILKRISNKRIARVSAEIKMKNVPVRIDEKWLIMDVTMNAGQFKYAIIDIGIISDKMIKAYSDCLKKMNFEKE